MNSKEIAENKNKHKGTFIIKVEHNCGSSWQGEIVWADANRTEKFRSTLELFKLMNGALESQGEQLDSEVDARIG